MTLMITGYTSKKQLKECIGEELVYRETSMFGPEYKSNGIITVAHRPLISGIGGKEFVAAITMQDDLIKKVT